MRLLDAAMYMRLYRIVVASMFDPTSLRSCGAPNQHTMQLRQNTQAGMLSWGARGTTHPIAPAEADWSVVMPSFSEIDRKNLVSEPAAPPRFGSVE